MFSAILPITELTSLSISNARILAQHVQVSEVILLNYSKINMALEYNVPKTRIVNYENTIYKALSNAIRNVIGQPEVIILDKNIQVGSRFMDQLVKHYAKNHLYTFKANTILPDNTVIVDDRIGNKSQPETFNVLALAFSRDKAIHIGCFDSESLYDFASKMKSIGKIKLLNQVLIHRTSANKSSISDRQPIPDKALTLTRVSTTKYTTTANDTNKESIPEKIEIVNNVEKESILKRTLPITTRINKPDTIKSKSIKYSIIMPYYNRDRLLINTLTSIEYWYNYRNDYEILIIEDYKNHTDSILHDTLLNAIKGFSDRINIKVIKNEVNCINPSVHFNIGVSVSKGEYIVLTNPECVHMRDTLKEYDKLYNINRDYYIVNGCINGNIFNSIDDSYENMRVEYIEWYQHSKSRNASFHFCSSISKDNYIRIGGFDETYKNGYAVEDMDFVATITSDDKLTIYNLDKSLILHQSHGITRPDNWYPLHVMNKLKYFNKWNKHSSAVCPTPIRQGNI